MTTRNNFVEATVNYTVPTGTKPIRYKYPRPEGRPDRSPVDDPRWVRIFDARSAESSFSLDDAGFALVGLATDGGSNREEWMRTAAHLVRNHTRAGRVHVFDVTERQSRHPGPRMRKPSWKVHGDYTERSAPQRIRDLLPAEAPKVLDRPFAFVNVWLPLGEPVLEAPLGLIHPQTLSEADLIPTTLRYRDRDGEIYHARFNRDHVWLHYRAMHPREALLLKTYDSRQDGRARFVLHSAFDDPASRLEEPPPRRSVEVRTIAFY